jgi:DNA polymerase III alpha subunit
VYGQILKSKQIESIGKLLESLNNKNEVVMRCAGILEGVKKRKTPTGIPYAFLSIMDGHHNMELTAFSKVLTEKYDILVENNLIIFTIHGRKEREKLRFSVRDLQSIEQFLSNTNYSLYIKTDGDDSNIQSVVDLLIRENQSSNQKNVDVIFAGNYMQYHLSHFLSHSVSFTEQLDSLGLIYNYGL